MPTLLRKIVFSSLLINIVLIMISVISILFYYPTSITHSLSNVNTMNTMLLVTRRIQISSFLSQTDSIFVFIWSFGILNYISFLINSIVYILDKLFKYEEKTKIASSVLGVILGGVIFINKIVQIEFLEKNIFKNFSIILTFGISFIILILGYFKNKRKVFKNEKILK